MLLLNMKKYDRDISYLVDFIHCMCYLDHFSYFVKYNHPGQSVSKLLLLEIPDEDGRCIPVLLRTDDKEPVRLKQT